MRSLNISPTNNVLDIRICPNGQQLVSSGGEMEALIREFEKRLLRENGDKPRSRQSYSRTIRRFLGHGNIKDKQPGDWTKQDINAVLDDWASERVWKPRAGKWGVRDANSIAQMTSALNRFFDFIERPELRQKPPKLEHKEVVPLTDEETLRVAEAVRKDKNPILAARNYIMVVMAADLAERNGEITFVRTNDLNFDRNEIILRKVKSGGDQHVPMSSTVIEAVRAYLEVRPKGRTPEDDEYLLLSRTGRRLTEGTTWDVIRKGGFKAGLQRRIYPHLLRHTRLTGMGNAGVPPTDILALSRQKDLKTLMKYIHADSKRVAKHVQETSIFNKKEESPITETPITTNDDNRRPTPSIEDAKLSLALRLANGQIDGETYKSAIQVLSGGILEELR